jgi:hypothetical protein
MNCVLLAPIGMGLEVLAPKGRGPDRHPPRQPQASGRKAADADAPPNGLRQPRRRVGELAAELERASTDSSAEERPAYAVGCTCLLGGVERHVREPRPASAPTGIHPDRLAPMGIHAVLLTSAGMCPLAPDLGGYARYRRLGVRRWNGAPRLFAPMGMSCVLLAPTGMGLEFLAPMGIDPDQHPPRQPQAPERKANNADAPPNGLHQPQAGTSTGSVERERGVVNAGLQDRPDPACRAACGVSPPVLTNIYG